MKASDYATELIFSFFKSIYSDYYKNKDEKSYTYVHHKKKAINCAITCIDEMIKREQSSGEYYTSVKWLGLVKEELLKTK
tara:strand:+ start:278 stop:517 length:240 start_codon:yes stop_codon:yes gene_type:complete